MDRFAAAAFEVATVVGGIVGAVLLALSFMPGNSAIQQGALAATAVALVAIPYCVAGVLHRAMVRKRLPHD